MAAHEPLPPSSGSALANSNADSEFICQKCSGVFSIEELFENSFCSHQICRQCTKLFLLDWLTLMCPLFPGCHSPMLREHASLVIDEDVLAAMGSDYTLPLDNAGGQSVVEDFRNLNLQSETLISDEQHFRCCCCSNICEMDSIFTISCCPHQMCRTCASIYIGGKVNAGDIPVVCPVSSCGKVICSDDMELILTEDEMQILQVYSLLREEGGTCDSNGVESHSEMEFVRGSENFLQADNQDGNYISPTDTEEAEANENNSICEEGRPPKEGVFLCDLCPGKPEHLIDAEFFEVKECRHLMCRSKIRQLLLEKITDSNFPLWCPACESKNAGVDNTAEVTFEDAAMVLTLGELATFEINYVKWVQNSCNVFECCICFDDTIPIDDLFVVSRCLSGHKTCRPCARQHVQTQYQNSHFPLTCAACDEELTIDEAELVLDVEDVERLMKNAFAKATSGDVHCPKTNCPGMAEVVPPRTHFGCPVCSYEMCTDCRKDWHRGLSCEQAKAAKQRAEGEKAAEDAFAQLAKNERLQICPRCKANVDRVSGCNHVVCRCGAGFCYMCTKLVPSANHGSASVWKADGHNCPLYSR